MLNNSAIHDLRASTSGTFLVTGSHNPEKHSPLFHSVKSVLSSLHVHDLLLLSTGSKSVGPLTPLPVSPYPARPGAAIRAHFVVDREPQEGGWRPWVGGLWGKWVSGTVLGYRDLAGRDAKVRTPHSILANHVD